MSQITTIESLALKAGLSLAKGVFSLMNLRHMPEVGGVEKNIVFRSVNGTDCKLDVSKPKGEGPFPIVMFIHGGGFVSGDKLITSRLANIFANKGYLVFNINYRLSPEVQYPEHLHDCMAALQWVKNNAQKYQGDTGRICVGGGSAGCYLAAALAINSQEGKNAFALQTSQEENFGANFDHHINATMLLNGVFDLDTVLVSGFPRVRFMIKLFFGDRFQDTSMAAHAGILNKVNKNFPKAFVAVGKDDSLYGQSTDMRDSLTGHGVSLSYHDYANSGHGWFNAFWKASARQSYIDMVVWLDKTFK